MTYIIINQIMICINDTFCPFNHINFLEYLWGLCIIKSAFVAVT